LWKRKFEHITPSLKELHWLPVQQRLYFKIAALTYNTVRIKEPGYLLEVIQFYEPVRSLHSSSQRLLSRARTHTVTATHAFKHSSVSVWNSLPVDICNCISLCTFRCHLEAFLFDLVLCPIDTCTRPRIGCVVYMRLIIGFASVYVCKYNFVKPAGMF